MQKSKKQNNSPNESVLKETIPSKRGLVKRIAFTLLLIFILGFIFGIYAYIRAREKALQKYVKIYQTSNLQAFEAFSTGEYRNSDEYQYRQSYFQDSSIVFIDLSDPNLEISYKKNADEFILKKVPFTLQKDSSKVKVFRDVTFKRTGLFTYGLEKEEYPLLNDASLTKNTSKKDIELSRELLEQAEKKIAANPREITKQILATINRWRVAWVAKDLDNYMSLYSEQAKISRVSVDKDGNIVQTNPLNKTQLRERMRKLNEKYDGIFVEVYDPKIHVYKEDGVRIEEIEVQATFGQLFSGRKGSYRYTDYGTKTMKFRHEIEGWKIFEESWQPRQVEMKNFREIFPEFFQN